ncbi:ATP-binding protein [Candidatus Babeliales bacterium]|nr:ATP-binding protein [Candidatus Babeliales bacterium]
MKRIIDHFLLEWKNRSNRKPLLLRGARQVGKTYALRTLGQTFTNFIEINLEVDKDALEIIERDMDPNRIVRQLSELLQQDIIPGSTLLFFDEIQTAPQAITALRYFYEKIPELHVVAAGSLLDFAIEQVGIPVGRVSSLFMYPLSFLEFLAALGHKEWVRVIVSEDHDDPISNPLHKQLLNLVGEYLAIGGMPEAVNEWVNTKTSRSSKIVHSDLIFNYQQDFEKYAKKHQMKYLNILFQKAIDQLSKKFMFSRIGEYKKRELEPALELLEKAGLFHKIMHSSGQGIPLGAQADFNTFKIIFLDTGLSQALLKLDIVTWLLNPTTAFVNKGEVVEAFVGQELLAYADPITKESLFYWRKQKRGSQAEVDYLVQIQDKVVPIEVKAGKSKRIKSLQIFLASHPNSTYGLRFSADPYSTYQKINNFPLYAVARPFLDVSENLREALLNLLKK